MTLPKRIRAIDLGEFWTDGCQLGEDELLLACSDPAANFVTVEPNSPGMELMEEMARCYNLVHDK